jgi:hypothetical protein
VPGKEELNMSSHERGRAKGARALFFILVLLLTEFTAAPRAQAGTPTADPGPRIERGFWQYSLETKTDLVKLVIRDKAGEVGTYKTLFTVTAPDQKQYSAGTNGAGALESAVFFPNDFGAEWRKGVYTWTCTIGGKMIVHGSFQYCTSCQIHLLQTNFSPELYSGR